MAALVHHTGNFPNIGFSHLDSCHCHNEVRTPPFRALMNFLINSFIRPHRLLGIPIIEDTEPAWFPANELREVHGIVPHEPSEIERTLFCIQADGSEGFCCPTYTLPEEELQEEE